MKKLTLKLGGKEMLSKEQMKKINGGTGSCAALVPPYVYPDSSCSVSPSQTPCESSAGLVLKYLYESEAICVAAAYHSHYCCDSCGSATWMC